jgi:dolichol kinase
LGNIPLNLFFITGLLFVWNLAIIHLVSKWVYNFILKKYNGVPAEYVGRKIVHIFNGGITALLVPIFYEGYYWIVIVSAFLFTGYIYFRRRWRLMYWFQVKENAYEVNFALMYGITLMIGVAVGDIWVGLIPILFMSFGDSATGLIRAFTQRRRIKSWDGTVAMIVVCSVIGYWKLGWYGVLVGIVVSFIEKIPRIDDNITVPIVAAILVYLNIFIIQ